jgi:hypothetical protein
VNNFYANRRGDISVVGIPFFVDIPDDDEFDSDEEKLEEIRQRLCRYCA